MLLGVSPKPEGSERYVRTPVVVCDATKGISRKAITTVREFAIVVND
jgi:hypothetical protein